MIGRQQRAQILSAGLKPCYRLQVDDGSLEATERYYRDRGLVFLVVRRRARFMNRDNVLAYVAREDATCRAVHRMDLATWRSPFDPAPRRELGNALGYPSCCVERFIGDRRGLRRRFNVPSGSQTRLLLWDRLKEASSHDARLNVVFPLFRNVSEHIPCSFRCAPSIAATDVALDLLTETDSSLRVRYAACFRVRLTIDGRRIRTYHRRSLENVPIALTARRPFGRLRTVEFE